MVSLFGAVLLGAKGHAAEIRLVEVDGTEFKVVTDDGSVLRSRELVGAVMTVASGGETLRLRLDAVERDPDAKRGEVWLHTFSAQAADGSWQNFCEPGPDGRRQGFPLAGRVRMPDLLFEPADPGTFELTCSAGAQGKCVRFGYLPWHGAADLALYNACVRMVRADYCGNGVGTTRDGMVIDVYDDRSIQTPESGPDFEFEAGWTAAGASCVRHTRVPQNMTVDALAQHCPRLAGRLGSTCTEAAARAAGAVLFNRSRTGERP